MMSLYLAETTWLHHLSARLKLGILALTTLVLMPFSSLVLWSSALVVCGVLYWSLGRAAIVQLKAYRPLLWMFALLFLIQWWVASWQAGLLIVLRMSSLILLANVVTITSKMDDITEVFLWLMTPLAKLGLNTQHLAFAMSLTIRFIPILVSLADALLDAWRTRGGGRHYWRIIAPMVIQSLLFSTHVTDAINARGGLPDKDNR